MKRPPSARSWYALLGVLLVAQMVVLSIHINRKWTGHHDWNGAVWAQSARNNLRAGLTTTLGVPASTYFGPLPIPADGYYVHHPSGLPLAVTAMFAFLGEREWAARLIPITCSILSTVLLWVLVNCWAGPRPATFTALVFLLLPMELYYGRMVNHEPCALMWMLAAMVALQRWELRPQPRWAVTMLACLFLGLGVAWSVYIFAVVVAGYLFARRKTLAAVAVLATVALAAALFLVQVRMVRADAWQDFFQATLRQHGQISSVPWLIKKLGSLGAKIPPVAWALALFGFISAARKPESRGLNLGAGGLLLTAAIFFAGVRHIVLHDYWGFYFVAPVAMMGGVGLDALWQWRGSFGRLIAVALLLWLGRCAVVETVALQRIQCHLLNWDTVEPENLIPDLGEHIAATFTEDTRVFCNFLAYPQPQLEYYARRRLVPAPHAEDWQWSKQPIGGVIWLDAPGAQELAAQLPPGTCEIVEFGQVRFLFWTPT